MEADLRLFLKNILSQLIINPLMDNKALIKLNKNFRLKEENGNYMRISINNLPLRKRSVFEAIGKQLGGLISISLQIFNWLDCSIALIKVEQNICGFIPRS